MFLRGTLFQGLLGCKPVYAPDGDGCIQHDTASGGFPSLRNKRTRTIRETRPAPAVTLYGNFVTRGTVRCGAGTAASPVSLMTCVISPLSSRAIVIM